MRRWLCIVLELSALATVLAVTVGGALDLASSGDAQILRTAYAFVLFFGLPFAGGALAVILASRHRPLDGWDVFGVTLLQSALTAIAIVVFRVDGLLCLAMATPLTLPFTWIGGVVANRCLSPSEAARNKGVRARSFALLPLVWIAMAAEPALLPEPELREISTSVEIAADADAVWQELIGFSEITAPRAWIFRVGIASPESAVLEGEGVGAVRRCVFSTGEFVEPITHWEPGRKLAFDVVQQPAPMTETSIWPDLDPPHLHDCFVSERGQFLLEPTPDGGIKLSGTTWYRQRLWPQFYWNAVADHLIHEIHARVLEHIKMAVESKS